MKRLLGHLAQFGSFFSQGELLCTQGLAYLLQEHPEARSALAAEIGSRSGVHPGEDLAWRAEAYQDQDAGRPDLEGCGSDGVPKVKVEAKLNAAFGERQLRSYMSDLQDRSPQGVLMILVPNSREREAKETAIRTLNLSGQPPWRAPEWPKVAITVMSWEDLLAALAKCDSEPLLDELAQFQAMYKALNYSIEPLRGRSDLLRWRDIEREKGTFTRLVDLVTRTLTTHHAVYPMGLEPLEQDTAGLEPQGYRRRYVCHPWGTSGSDSCYCIGVRDPFATSDTPIWLRFHRATPHFDEIGARLEAVQPLAARLVWSSGHIWIPLEVPVEAGEDEMLSAIITQVHTIVHLAIEHTNDAH